MHTRVFFIAVVRYQELGTECSMKNNSYRTSWITFVLALTSFVLIPVLLFIIDDGRLGWDQIPKQLDIMVGGYAIAFVFLAVSFVSGLYAWEQRKIVLLWVIPSGMLVLLTVVYLAVFLVGPYWQANWL